MRYLTAIILALASSASAGETDAPIGSWEYHGSDAHLSVHLKPGGECMITGTLASADEAHLVRCTYSVQGPYVSLNWEQQPMQQSTLRLVLIGGGELMRVEGESKRTLRRISDAR